LSRDEIAALLKVCQHDSSPTGVRDAALIAILRGSGVRRRELVNLDLSDFEESTGAIEVREGKGGKDRTVYLVQSGDSGGVKLAYREGGRSWTTVMSGEQRQASHHQTTHLPVGAIHLAKAGRRGGCGGFQYARFPQNFYLRPIGCWCGLGNGSTPRGTFRPQYQFSLRQKTRGGEAASGGTVGASGLPE
jgi:hypothetical protein